MDLIVVDVTDVPRGQPSPPASRVDLLNDELAVDEAGARAGTMGYEILTGLGRRYPPRLRGRLEWRGAEHA